MLQVIFNAEHWDLPLTLTSSHPELGKLIKGRGEEKYFRRYLQIPFVFVLCSVFDIGCRHSLLCHVPDLYPSEPVLAL